MIDRKKLRNFMEQYMRERLFRNAVFSRERLCYCYEMCMNSLLSLDDRIELIRILLSIKGNSDAQRYLIPLVEDITKEEYSPTHSERLIFFRVDPVNQDNWEEFLNAIYQEA